MEQTIWGRLTPQGSLHARTRVRARDSHAQPRHRGARRQPVLPC